ncbi:hypothetical protein BH10ACI1_BH10ACI1_01710 [soil metagenome]
MKKSLKSFSFILFIAFSLFIFTNVSAQNPSGYHLLKKIEIGGEGGWDYLFADADGHRLYVSHSTKIVVVDTESATVIGEITNLKGVHGVAVVKKFGRGFISDGRDNSVVIFDLKTFKTLDTVKVGKNPDCIMYDTTTKHIFAFNRGDSNVSAIDAASGKVVGTLELDGHPEFAQADGKGMIFVNIDNKSEVVAFDAKTLTIKNRWAIAPGEDNSGLAIDRKNHRLFIVCDNKKMVVMNYDNGKIVAELSIGEGTDAAAFDPNTNLVFSSNGECNMTIVREDSKDKYSVVETITTQRGARTMTIDTKTHKLYLATAQFGETPVPTKENPRPRPTIVPNSFVILVYGK